MSALGDIYLRIDERLGSLLSVASYERMPSGDPASFPALAVFDGGDEPIDGEPGGTRLQALFTLEGYIEGGDGAGTHDELLQLHAEAVFALCGDDGTLGGLVETIEIVGQRRAEVAELAAARRLGFAQDFAVTFSTVRGDPSTLA